MEKQNQSQFLPALIYTGIIAGIYILYTIIIDILSANFSKFNMFGSWILLLGGLAYAMYAFRKEYNNNSISYGKAFGFGMLVAVMLAVVLVIFSYIYMTWINPDIIQMGRDYAEQKMLQKGVSEDLIERQMEMTEKFSKPPYVFIFGLLQYLLFFTVFNLIAAAFIRKEPANPFENEE